MSTGSESVVNSMASSSTTESTLPDNWGTSGILCSGISLGSVVAAHRGEVAVAVSQQNVSRFHNRQLRFSNRRPCSTESAHLEKTEQVGLAMIYTPHKTVGDPFSHLPVHMLKRFCALCVSTLWMTFGSTVRTNPSALQGIVPVASAPPGCSSRYRVGG